MNVHSQAQAAVYVDGAKTDEAGHLSLSAGVHELLVLLTVPENYCAGDRLDFSCTVTDGEGKALVLENPLFTFIKVIFLLIITI